MEIYFKGLYGGLPRIKLETIRKHWTTGLRVTKDRYQPRLLRMRKPHLAYSLRAHMQSRDPKLRGFGIWLSCVSGKLYELLLQLRHGIELHITSRDDVAVNRCDVLPVFGLGAEPLSLGLQVYRYHLILRSKCIFIYVYKCVYVCIYIYIHFIWL